MMEAVVCIFLLGTFGFLLFSFMQLGACPIDKICCWVWNTWTWTDRTQILEQMAQSWEEGLFLEYWCLSPCLHSALLLQGWASSWRSHAALVHVRRSSPLHQEQSLCYFSLSFWIQEANVHLPTSQKGWAVLLGRKESGLCSSPKVHGAQPDVCEAAVGDWLLGPARLGA